MRKSIIFGGSILCVFILLMIPNISAMQYQIREETIKSSVYENPIYKKFNELKEKLDYISGNVQSFLLLGLLPILFIIYELILLFFTLITDVGFHISSALLIRWLWLNICVIGAIFEILAIIFLDNFDNCMRGCLNLNCILQRSASIE